MKIIQRGKNIYSKVKELKAIETNHQKGFVTKIPRIKKYKNYMTRGKEIKWNEMKTKVGVEKSAIGLW